MLITNSNRQSKFPVSILNNTNRLVSSSGDNFGGLRQGSFIKIGEENILYQVAKAERFYFLKDFKVIGNREIFIDSDTEINLQKEDIIKVIYDEYELRQLINIVKAGKFFKTDELLTVLGGELSIDMSSGIGESTKFRVVDIDESGGVKQLATVKNGKYISPPPNTCEVKGEIQTAELELAYKQVDSRSIIERTIKGISKATEGTTITLDYSLPMSVKGGKLSVEKWELILLNNYMGPTLINGPYSLYKDFTPNLQIPLMLKNSTSVDLIFNQAMQKIDAEIQSIKNKI